jgi:lipopolysaccharide transport system permease protein
MLALRDVKLRYKQTAFGVTWVVLQPLLAGAIFALIFGHFARMPSEGHPYLLFVFTGLVCWNLFAGVLQRSGNSLVAEARLVTKVYFPRLLIPLASACAVLVDFVVGLGVVVTLLAWFRVWPGVSLLLLPAALLLALVLAVGVGLWISALNVRYRDFSYALPFLIQVWMYASPVVYSTSLVPDTWRRYLALNPMTGALELFRVALLGGVPTPAFLLFSIGSALVFIVSGALYFRRVERDFADSL